MASLVFGEDSELNGLEANQIRSLQMLYQSFLALFYLKNNGYNIILADVSGMFSFLPSVFSCWACRLARQDRKICLLDSTSSDHLFFLTHHGIVFAAWNYFYIRIDDQIRRVRNTKEGT